MTDENQQGTPEPQVEEQAPETKDEQTESNEETQKDEGSAQLEAQLKLEREQREKAEKALAEKSFKQREKQRQEEEEEEPQPKPLSEADIDAIVSKKLDAERKLTRASEIERLAGQLSDSDIEKQLIIEIHRNRVFPSHLSLEEQLNEAQAIAVSKKIVGENQELKRALLGKKGSTKSSTQTHHDSMPGSEPKLPPADKAVLTAQGWKWNATSRKYEKKIGTKDKLIRHDDGRTEFIQG